MHHSLSAEGINVKPLSYSWTSNHFLNGTTCPELTIRPTTSAFYTLFLTDENGCTVTDQIYVETTPLPSLYIPDLFSPILDGPNLFVIGPVLPGSYLMRTSYESYAKFEVVWTIWTIFKCGQYRLTFSTYYLRNIVSRRSTDNQFCTPNIQNEAEAMAIAMAFLLFSPIAFD